MSGSEWVIERINKNPLSQEEMLNYAEEVCFLEPGERDFEGYAITAIRLFAPDKGKVFSAHFRMEALANFVDNEKVPGWAGEEESDGSVRIRKALVAAAGVQPVKKRGKKEIVFEREGLLAAAFRISKDMR
jgi:hypothetical protein